MEHRFDGGGITSVGDELLLREVDHRLGLAGSQHARAQCTTIPLKLLEIGAPIKITVCEVWLSYSEAYPHASAWAKALANIRRYPAWTPPG